MDYITMWFSQWYSIIWSVWGIFNSIIYYALFIYFILLIRRIAIAHEKLAKKIDKSLLATQ